MGMDERCLLDVLCFVDEGGLPLEKYRTPSEPDVAGARPDVVVAFAHRGEAERLERSESDSRPPGARWGPCRQSSHQRREGLAVALHGVEDVFRVLDLSGVFANAVLGGVIARREKLDPIGFAPYAEEMRKSANPVIALFAGLEAVAPRSPDRILPIL